MFALQKVDPAASRLPLLRILQGKTRRYYQSEERKREESVLTGFGDRCSILRIQIFLESRTTNTELRLQEIVSEDRH